MSVPLGKGDRVGTRLGSLQGVGHVVYVCFESCYVGQPFFPLFFLDFESTLLTRQLHQERTQMEAQ